MLGQGSAVSCTRFLHNQDLRAQVGRRRGRSARSTRRGRAAPQPTSTPSWWRWSIADGGCERRRVGRTVVLRLRLRRLHARQFALTPWRRRPPTAQVVLTAARALLEAARPTIDQRAAHLHRRGRHQPGRRLGHPARPALRRARRSERGPRPRPCARPLRHLVGHLGGAARPRSGPSMPMLPIDQPLGDGVQRTASRPPQAMAGPSATPDSGTSGREMRLGLAAVVQRVHRRRHLRHVGVEAVDDRWCADLDHQAVPVRSTCPTGKTRPGNTRSPRPATSWGLGAVATAGTCVRCGSRSWWGRWPGWPSAGRAGGRCGTRPVPRRSAARRARCRGRAC